MMNQNQGSKYKILVLTMSDITSMEKGSIYGDLLLSLRNDGHSVRVVTPLEKRLKLETNIIDENGISLLRVKTGNLFSTNIIEKIIAQLGLVRKYRKAMALFFPYEKYDMILYSTPPVTIVNLVKHLKRQTSAFTYLMLKDIFPQNAVDLGFISGRGLVYSYFRKKEQALYKISDRIGCMSSANVEYILSHNSYISRNKVELCPNSLLPRDLRVTEDEKFMVRKHYGLPQEKCIFVYGGNIGKPQGIDFIIDCLRSQKWNDNVYFLIIGGGTEFNRLEKFIVKENPNNVELMKTLNRPEFEKLIASCDVGLLFLDKRFTIPNFPSRLLSYMQAGLPIFACTDLVTDVGSIITRNGFGWWCRSGDLVTFSELINSISDRRNALKMGIAAFNYFESNFSVERVKDIILNNLNELQ